MLLPGLVDLLFIQTRDDLQKVGYPGTVYRRASKRASTSFHATDVIGGGLFYLQDDFQVGFK